MASNLAVLRELVYLRDTPRTAWTPTVPARTRELRLHLIQRVDAVYGRAEMVNHP